MADTAAGTDMGLGLALFFGVLAVVGALGMLVAAHENVIAGWSFALAMIAGALAVAAPHVYGARHA